MFFLSELVGGKMPIKKNKRPLIDSLGQIENQMTFTAEGDVIDQNETRPEVIDSNGLTVISEDEEKLKEYIKEAISVSSFVETFKHDAHDTLIKLLALQDNKNPLKKGGAGIAYRTDVLLMHCKMEFSVEENIVFDAILGMISSLPENETYRLEPGAFQKFVKYSDDSYIYKIFKKGTEKLKKRHLEFEFDDDEVSVPWFDILHYHGIKSKGTDVAYLEFAPTDFFKDLALCSGIVHGAYGKLEVTTQLQGKYTIALYWFLESKKRFREYPGASEGEFTISIDDFKYQFSIPKSYQTNDIKRRALEPAKKSINAVQECDFTFDYIERKDHGTIVGYKFVIKNKQYIESGAEVKRLENKADDALFSKVKMLLETSDIEFTDEQIRSVCDQANRCGKDAKDMMQIIVDFRKRLDDEAHEPVVEPLKYLCRMISLSGQPNQAYKNTNKFHDFEQNDINFAELEKQLLDN